MKFGCLRATSCFHRQRNCCEMFQFQKCQQTVPTKFWKALAKQSVFTKTYSTRSRQWITALPDVDESNEGDKRTFPYFCCIRLFEPGVHNRHGFNQIVLAIREEVRDIRFGVDVVPGFTTKARSWSVFWGCRFARYAHLNTLKHISQQATCGPNDSKSWSCRANLSKPGQQSYFLRMIPTLAQCIFRIFWRSFWHTVWKYLEHLYIYINK